MFGCFTKDADVISVGVISHHLLLFIFTSFSYIVFSPQERKILRQFWNSKGLHTRDASFHVVITSYQLVITDIKYFNRIKWQYLILDEAQAIKSSSRYALLSFLTLIASLTF